MSVKKTSIGGQALIEGIMMRGPEKTAMAVRNTSGKIITEEWKNSGKSSPILRLPIIRGIFGMASSLTLGYKCMMRSADIAVQDILTEQPQADVADTGAACDTPCPDTDDTDVSAPETVTGITSAQVTEVPETHDMPTDIESTGKKTGEKAKNPVWFNITMVASIVIAFVLMIGIFILLPTFLGSLIFGDVEGFWGRLGRSAFEGVLKIVLLVTYMWAISYMKDIRRTFMYHGAEHKTIFCYEHGLELTVENVRKQGRFHPRCGTSFLILMLIVGIFIGFFINVESWLLRFVIRLLLLPITIGIGYELIKFAGRHDNTLTKIISAPGIALQHITVLEPDDSMIECAIEAMTRVIPDDPDKDNW